MRHDGMAAVGRLLLYIMTGVEGPVLGCGFNRSTQHLISKYREEDVEYEVQTEDLLLRCTEGIDVGSMGERRFYANDSN